MCREENKEEETSSKDGYKKKRPWIMHISRP